MKKIFYVFAALAVMAAACTKPEPITPSITLTSQAEVGVPVDGSTETVTFEANVPWTASLDNSNWTISPSSGEAGTVSVKVSSTPNATNDPVYATLTIKAQTATQTVKFIQVQKDGMVISTTEYEAPAEASTVTVKVMANVAVKATTSTAWITIPEPTKGLVEKDFALAIAANEGEAREGTVVFEGAGTPVEVTIKQAAFVPAFDVDCLEFDVPKKGGEYTINITTNVEFTVTDYSDGAFPYQHATLATDGKSLKVVIDANEDKEARDSYIKFTVPSIQDPDIDEETGEPTGETVDHTVRVYFHQEGIAHTNWTVALPEASMSGGKLCIAKAGDSYFLFDGVDVYLFNPTSGEFLAATQTVKSIAAKALRKSGKVQPLTKGIEDLYLTEVFNDDVDNIIIVLGGNGYLAPCAVLVVPSGTQITDDAEPELLLYCYVDYYSAGMANFVARGNVLADGVVAALLGAGKVTEWGGFGVPTAGAYWDIKDGEVEWTPYGEEEEPVTAPKYYDLGENDPIWVSTRAAFGPLGTRSEAGFLYGGYDGVYSLLYCIGGTTAPIGAFGDWASGVSCIQSADWAGTPVVAIANMSWFPVWSINTVVSIVNVADMTELASIAIAPQYTDFPLGADYTWAVEPTVDVRLEQKGDALIVYVADGAKGVLSKYTIEAE